MMESLLSVNIAIREQYVYGKDVWKTTKTGQTLIAEHEANNVALRIDPHAVTWKLSRKDELVSEVVCHVPR